MSFFSTSNRPAPVEAVPFNGPLIQLRNVEKSFDTAAGRSYVLRRILRRAVRHARVQPLGPPRR